MAKSIPILPLFVKLTNSLRPQKVVTGPLGGLRPPVWEALIYDKPSIYNAVLKKTALREVPGLLQLPPLYNCHLSIIFKLLLI